jgi:hypothetical protein
MKWFKHFTDSHVNGKMRQILRKHGLEGYAFCWVCRELIGKEGSGKFRISSEKEWKLTLKDITGLSEEKIKSYLEYQAQIGAIDHKALEKGDLYIPKMKEYADEYNTRVSRQSPDTLVIDKIRLDKIRLEYIKIKRLDIKNFFPDDFARTAKSIKNLVSKANNNDELVIQALHWIAKQTYEWTLETLNRKWPEFMRENKPRSEIVPEKIIPINPEEHAKVSKLIHETTIKMKND